MVTQKKDDMRTLKDNVIFLFLRYASKALKNL